MFLGPGERKRERKCERHIMFRETYWSRWQKERQDKGPRYTGQDRNTSWPAANEYMYATKRGERLSRAARVKGTRRAEFKNARLSSDEYGCTGPGVAEL